MSITVILIYIVICVGLLSFLSHHFEKLLRIAQITLGIKQRDKHKKTVWDIPGPTYIPLLGTKWIFYTNYKISKAHEAYSDLNSKYGPILREITPTGIPIIHLYDRQDIEKVLRYPSKYPFRPPTEIVSKYRRMNPDRYASIGLTNEQGENWHNLRMKLTPHITSPRVLQAFLPSLNSICDDFIKLLRANRDGSTNIVTNFQDLANLMGLEAICMLTLGKRMGFLASDQKQPGSVKVLAAAVKQLFISQRDSYYGIGLWKYLPTKTYKKFAESEGIIYDTISQIVEAELKQSQFNCNDDDIRCVLIKILQTEDLDIRDKKSAIIDFIAAGIETLANTLIFTLYLISQSNEIKDNIFNEFVETEGRICSNHLAAASYTKACIQEGFRLNPTAFILARVLETDMNLSGYELKAGTFVLCQTMIACQKESNFSEPHIFKPSRWLTQGNISRIEPGSNIVVPFGVGKRACPGKRFVEMELILLIAKLSLAFDFQFDGELETDFEFLLAPKTPVNLILRDRQL